jgi:hypothetical protein
VVEIPTPKGPITERGLRMNNNRRHMTDEIIKKYLDGNITEPSTSQSNKTAFLIKMQCTDKKTRASKKRKMVEKNREFNTKIVDKVFDTPSVGRLAKKVKYHIFLNQLKHEGQVFKCAMKKVLDDWIEKHCLVYEDDKELFDKTFACLVGSLDLVLSKIPQKEGSKALRKQRLLAEKII